MKSIKLEKITEGMGFVAKPTVKVLEGVKFANGKIAYLDGQDVRVLNHESELEDRHDLKIVEGKK